MAVRMNVRITQDSGRFTVASTPPKIIPPSGAWVPNPLAVISNGGKTIETKTAGLAVWDKQIPDTSDAKVYLEVKISKDGSMPDNEFLPMIGWSSSDSISFFNTNAGNGVVRQFFLYGPNTLGFRSSGTSSPSSQPGGTGLAAVKSGDVIMLARNVTTGRFWFGINGIWSKGATNTDIAANLKPTNTTAMFDVPHLLVDNGWGNLRSLRYEVNRDEADFVYSVPSGFVSIGSPL